MHSAPCSQNPSSECPWRGPCGENRTAHPDPYPRGASQKQPAPTCQLWEWKIPNLMSQTPLLSFLCEADTRLHPQSLLFLYSLWGCAILFNYCLHYYYSVYLLFCFIVVLSRVNCFLNPTGSYFGICLVTTDLIWLINSSPFWKIVKFEQHSVLLWCPNSECLSKIIKAVKRDCVLNVQNPGLQNDHSRWSDVLYWGGGDGEKGLAFLIYHQLPSLSTSFSAILRKICPCPALI